jgi:hypothetical protein
MNSTPIFCSSSTDMTASAVLPISGKLSIADTDEQKQAIRSKLLKILIKNLLRGEYMEFFE